MEAAFLSKYGHELSFEEAFIRNYYLVLDECEAAVKTKDSFFLRLGKVKLSDDPRPDFPALLPKLKEAQQQICTIFLDAVNNHDSKQISALAKAAKFFKDWRHRHGTEADRERKVLLFLKEITMESGEALTIREIANLVASEVLPFGFKLEITADGFSALRRKCKQLGLPIAPSRKKRSK
jgi:hypothetical protein